MNVIKNYAKDLHSDYKLKDNYSKFQLIKRKFNYLILTKY